MRRSWQQVAGRRILGFRLEYSAFTFQVTDLEGFALNSVEIGSGNVSS